jgi:hypothetical protein
VYRTHSPGSNTKRRFSVAVELRSDAKDTTQQSPIAMATNQLISPTNRHGRIFTFVTSCCGRGGTKAGRGRGQPWDVSSTTVHCTPLRGLIIGTSVTKCPDHCASRYNVRCFTFCSLLSLSITQQQGAIHQQKLLV